MKHDIQWAIQRLSELRPDICNSEIVGGIWEMIEPFSDNPKEKLISCDPLGADDLWAISGKAGVYIAATLDDRPGAHRGTFDYTIWPQFIMGDKHFPTPTEAIRAGFIVWVEHLDAKVHP